MPENLRITTAIPTSDSVIKPNTPQESSQVDAVNPTRVSQPNTKDQKSEGQSMDLLLNRESVFGEFVQQLKGTPGLSQTLEKLLFDFSGRQVDLLDILPKDSPLRFLASGIPASKGEMLESLEFQQRDGTRFTGPLFRLLGRLSEQSGDDVYSLYLADFLKAFDGYESAGSTLQAILANLDAIEKQLSAPYAKQLREARKALLTQSGGETVKNDEAGEAPGKGGSPQGLHEQAEADLASLKKNILPLLGDYIAKSGDYGKVREDISFLLHNVSILNVGTRENLEASFAKLIAYCRHSLRLPEDTLRQLEVLCAEQSDAGTKKSENEFFRALLPLLSEGVKDGTAGFEKSIFQDICRNLLLDSSVYMPFRHFFLPVCLEGRSLFAQMWVEKKKENESSRQYPAQELPSSVFLTFDIQGLGYFEAVLTLTGRRADIRLNCPPPLVKKGGDIAPDLSRILRNNGLTAGEIRVGSSDRPEIPGLILQKVNERKHAVDVTV